MLGSSGIFWDFLFPFVLLYFVLKSNRDLSIFVFPPLGKVDIEAFRRLLAYPQQQLVGAQKLHVALAYKQQHVIGVVVSYPSGVRTPRREVLPGEMTAIKHIASLSNGDQHCANWGATLVGLPRSNSWIFMAVCSYATIAILDILVSIFNAVFDLPTREVLTKALHSVCRHIRLPSLLLKLRIPDKCFLALLSIFLHFYCIVYKFQGAHTSLVDAGWVSGPIHSQPRYLETARVPLAPAESSDLSYEMPRILKLRVHKAYNIEEQKIEQPEF